jgi:hypothetical protein
MNYFGHAALAVLKGGTSKFVLGAMLPDLLPMARVRDTETFDDSELALGVQFHLQTDSLFHETEAFITLNREALKELRSQGISRGPARACAHMGVEMLIDARLAEERNFHDGYLEALASGAGDPLLFGPHKREAGERVRALCDHLAEKGKGIHAATRERFALRLGRTLENRPRLRPTESELVKIADYLCDLEEVGRRVPELMEQLSPLTK